MSSRPLALTTVITPAYRSEVYLREAVRSVLGQTEPRLELIVVDDGSRDDSVRAAATVDQLYGPPPADLAAELGGELRA